jgi:hypothetical protein
MANGLLPIGDIAGSIRRWREGRRPASIISSNTCMALNFVDLTAEQQHRSLWKVQSSEAWRSQVISKDYWPREQGPKRQKHQYVVVLRESLRYLWGAIP